MNLIMNFLQYRENLIHYFFSLNLYSLHNFLNHLKNSMMLCSSKYNILRNFKINISIIYCTAEQIKKKEQIIDVNVLKEFINERIFKLFDFKVIMISTIIT